MNQNESQLGQDLFARICKGDQGVLVDIGCNCPGFFSNSAPLIRRGWIGVGIDLDPGDWSEYPLFDVSKADATTFDWSHLLWHVHYLSVDVDEYSLQALARFASTYQGSPPICATIEHDQYKLGPRMMQMQNRLMGEMGYVLVGNNLWNFENWFVHETHPGLQQIAMLLTPWGDEDNSDVSRIPEFKESLKEHLRLNGCP